MEWIDLHAKCWCLYCFMLMDDTVEKNRLRYVSRYLVGSLVFENMILSTRNKLSGWFSLTFLKVIYFCFFIFDEEPSDDSNLLFVV